MTKAQILLTGVALFSMAGGALAFKAMRISDRVYIRATGSTICTLAFFGVTTLPNGNPAGVVFATTVPGGCPVPITIYHGE